MATRKSTSLPQTSSQQSYPSIIPVDQSYINYAAPAPYSPWSGLGMSEGGLSSVQTSNNSLTGAQSAVPYQQSMFTDKFNFNTPGYGQMAAYGPPAPAPAIAAVGGTGAAVTSGAAQSPWSWSLGGSDLLSDAWNKAGDLGNGITDSMKGFNKWGQDTGLLGGTKMVDGKEVKTDGWGGLALGAANGVFNAYNSLATLNATKDMLETQKHFANANLQNGQKSYNTQIENRQRDRVASNPNEMSVSDYMAKHRLG